jgi:predicted transcriptional regulator
MAKANISMPDGMLEEIDRRAKASGSTRSGVIQEAAAQYLARLDAQTEHDARRERILAAQKAMRKIGESFPPGPTGTELIRAARDATPRWLDDEGDSDE